MGIDLRQPNISGNDHEMLLGVKSYLFQLREQLQWAFDNLDLNGSGGKDESGGTVNNTTIINQTTVPAGEKEAQATFDAIKSFIIKAADIADAYYEIVSTKLQSSYVAKSEYGDYVKNTTALIEKSSEKIDQNYKDIQVIIQDVDNLDLAVHNQETTFDEKLADTKTEIEDQVGVMDKLRQEEEKKLANDLDSLGKNLDAFTSIIKQEGAEAEKVVYIGVKGLIRSGLLGYNENGVAIYGIEVGQQVVNAAQETVFRATAQFRPDKLVFFDSNGDAVAYISNQKLYINYAEINDSFKIGSLVDRVITSGEREGDIVTRWEE